MKWVETENGCSQKTATMISLVLYRQVTVTKGLQQGFLEQFLKLFKINVCMLMPQKYMWNRTLLWTVKERKKQNKIRLLLFNFCFLNIPLNYLYDNQFAYWESRNKNNKQTCHYHLKEISKNDQKNQYFR